MSGFTEYVLEDLFGGERDIAARAMFGAHGIYRGEVMFAVIADDVLFFKTDASNRADYEKAGSRPLTYMSRGKKIELSYHEVPAAVLEDRGLFREWAGKSYLAGVSQAELKAARKRRPPARGRER